MHSSVRALPVPIQSPTRPRRAGALRRVLMGVPLVLVTIALVLPASSTAAKTRKVALGVSIEDRWNEAATFDHFADHSIGRYITHIRAAVEEEQRLTLRTMRPRVRLHVPQRRAA